MKIIIRPFDPIYDSPLIFSTWRKSVWFDDHTKEDKFDPAFFRIKTKEINEIIKSPDANVKIACLADDPDQIVGYTVLLDSTIEFVYVKLDYRKQGIATLLTKGFKEVAEPSTKIGSAITKEHGLRIKKNEEKSNGNSKEHGLQTEESF